MRGTSWWLILLVVVIGTAAGIFGGSFLAGIDQLSRIIPIGNVVNPFGEQRYVRILMMGEDNTARGRTNGHGLSDTLVVMAIDTQTKEVRAISIPRDTMVEIPGHRTSKINSANVYGGPELAKQTIQDLLGVPIDYYVATTTQGLRGLVELVGGVYIIIDKNMHYDDRRGDLHIDFKASPDKQLLNGEQAEEYVRFRHDAVGDSGYIIRDGKKVSAGRTVRQQKFMRALANRIMALPTKRERADVLTTAVEKGYLLSNLSMSQWNDLAEFLKDVDPEKMLMTVLPGAPGNIHGASYWLPDMEQVGVIVNQNLLFQTDPVADVVEIPLPKIEVLNGSGIRGVAGQVAEKLKGAGFTIERTANAPKHDYTDCCIITRNGKTAWVDKIAKLLNCADIREEPMESGKPDVTVIVGSNYTAML